MAAVWTWVFDFSQGNLIQRVAWDSNGNAIYMGWAQAGTSESASEWRIVQNTYDASNQFTGSGFPNVGNHPSVAFSFKWSDRTTYTYS